MYYLKLSDIVHEMPAHDNKSLYCLADTKNVQLYDGSEHIGTTTGHRMRPNDTLNSLGSLEIIDVDGKSVWIEGYGTFVFGFGIKLWHYHIYIYV